MCETLFLLTLIPLLLPGAPPASNESLQLSRDFFVSCWLFIGTNV